MNINWYYSLRQLKNNLYPLTELNRENLQQCIDHWKLVQDAFLNSQFKSDLVEIEFFRNVKPRFTSYIDFYLLLNEAGLFCPPDQVAARQYWENELRRIGRFEQANHDFINYVENGDTSLDEKYFLRRTNTEVAKAEEYIFFDEHCRTMKDGVLRRYYAFRMYRRFVQHKTDSLHFPLLRRA